VANLHIERALHDRPGAPPSWDNVLYGSAGLGYVDAMHQNLQRVPGATVLTYYPRWATRPTPAASCWSALEPLARRHRGRAVRAAPDLREKLRRIDITRYGHAMAVPVPGMLAKSHLSEQKWHDPQRQMVVICYRITSK
jgi:hypothetical protein